MKNTMYIRLSITGVCFSFDYDVVFATDTDGAERLKACGFFKVSEEDLENMRYDLEKIQEKMK
jgi:hypothetical protein